MKIVIIHYRYYLSSGPEKYLFNVSEILENKGHVVIPFSLNYRQNNNTKYSIYFPNPIVDEFHIDKNKNDISFLKKLKIIKNSFYNKDVYLNLSLMLEKEKPDIAYILQYGTKLSSSIFKALQKYNIPTILRVSDYNLVCAKNTLYRNGEICTKCLRAEYNLIKYKCVHNNFLQSIIYYFIQKYNESKKIQNQINTIIAPSLFTIEILKKSKQFHNSIFKHLPTFYNLSEKNIYSPKSLEFSSSLKICYWGRISEDKGIDLLIEAISIVINKGYKISLKIIGDVKSCFAQEQIRKVKEKKIDNITFKGFIPNNKLFYEISPMHFSIIPSKWYDNLPNSLIESCIIGLPVIVANIGSLKEVITENYNGFTFEANNAKNLASKLIKLTSLEKLNYIRISNNAQEWIKCYSDPNEHYLNLIDIFNEAINESYNKQHH